MAKKSSERSMQEINEAIRYVCARQIGVIDTNFLCQSISVIEPRPHVALKENATVEEAIEALRAHKMGCVLIVDEKGKLTGIFSERDFILKVSKEFERARHESVINYMTRNPVTQEPDAAIAYVLNLMSHGGFRHLPIVDNEGAPIAMISVKDVIDYIVTSFTEDLLNFKTEGV